MVKYVSAEYKIASVRNESELSRSFIPLIILIQILLFLYNIAFAE